MAVDSVLPSQFPLEIGPAPDTLRSDGTTSLWATVSGPLDSWPSQADPAGHHHTGKRRRARSRKVASMHSEPQESVVPLEKHKSDGFWEWEAPYPRTSRWEQSSQDTSPSRVETWLSLVATRGGNRGRSQLLKLKDLKERHAQACAKASLEHDADVDSNARDRKPGKPDFPRVPTDLAPLVGPTASTAYELSSDEPKAKSAEKKPLAEALTGELKWLCVSGAIFATPFALCVAGLLAYPALAIPALGLWAIVEGAFMTMRSWELTRISNEVADLPLPSIEDQEKLFQRVLELQQIGVKPEQFLSRWFLGAPVGSLSRERVANFLACSFYHRFFKDLPLEWQRVVQDKIDRLEVLFGFQFRRQPEEDPGMAKVDGWGEWVQHLTGHRNSLPYMAHTMEPLKAVVHPLALYTWGHIVGGLTIPALAAMGFQRKVCRSTGYAYFVLRRDPMAGEALGDDGEDLGDACIFVHGLGVGITPYLVFVEQLIAAYPHRTVALMELPHLAFRICSPIPPVERLVEGMDEVVADVAGASGKVSIVGHSFGSLVAANYVRTRPSRVASLGLVDPVSILLCLPDVVFNFIYKKPDGIEDTIRTLMVSREMNVAQALCRVFNWHTLLLWADQMPKRSVVMLAGKDSIVPSAEVKRYLDMHGIPVIYNEEFKHAEFLARPAAQRDFLQALFPPGKAAIPSIVCQ